MNTAIQDGWNLGWKLALAARGPTEALVDSYDTQRRPVAGVVVGFTDRAVAVATSTGPLLRTLRTRVVPRLLALVLGSDRGVAYGFRTCPNWGSATGTARRPGGPPRAAAGPRAGDRLPDARVARDGQVGWLGAALAAPRLYLLVCGGSDEWDADQLAALRGRHPGLLAAHHLPRDAVPGALHDLDGHALARLGVNETAHYLVRPDGHVGYRAAATDLDGLHQYLNRWLPNPTAHPA